MIQFIEKLLQRGVAYATDDGSVYFSIDKFPSYGKLSRLDRSQLKPGSRVDQDEHSKESYGDFALWKGYTEKDGAVFWNSPWGKGRPGWHIECSCMSMKHLGESLDIHCGGEDLIFPHHDDEIAQSEAGTGKPFVRYWLHSAHLMVDGQKMSKSLGNFYTLRDLESKGFTGQEIRYALVSVHYRLPLNFTLDGLAAARQTLRRLEAWVERLKSTGGSAQTPEKEGKLYQDFCKALDSDLNISEALGKLFEEVRESNRRMDEPSLSQKEAAVLYQDWERIERILGIELRAETSIPAEVTTLAEEREQARKNRDWKRSDELRNELKNRGWQIQDVKTGGYKLIALTP
jgi:cysteinyl-tRNA synthetase